MAGKNSQLHFGRYKIFRQIVAGNLRQNSAGKNIQLYFGRYEIFRQIVAVKIISDR